MKGALVSIDAVATHAGPKARVRTETRHFALNLVRTTDDKQSIKSKRKLAGWKPDALNAIVSSKLA